MWLFGKHKDLSLLFIPVWIIWIVLFFLPNNFLQNDVPLWIWVVFILGIDVTHVWSTIFRTYLDKEEFNNHKTVLILAPIIAFILLFGIAREAPRRDQLRLVKHHKSKVNSRCQRSAEVNFSRSGLRRNIAFQERNPIPAPRRP